MKNLWMVLLMTLTVPVFAQDANQAPTDPKMAEAMRLGQPSEGHRQLDALVGDFKAKTTWRMKKDAPDQYSEGKSETKWILDGRFIQQTFKGDMMGQPFEGINIIGYDNVGKKYNAVWLDSMNTGMTKSTSTYDAATQTFSEEGTFSCPMTGKDDNKYKAVTKIIDKDHYTYEMWHDDENGDNYKAMTIQYERD